MTERGLALTFAGAALGGAGLAFLASGRVRLAALCVGAQFVTITLASGLAARLWRRIAVGRYPVYTGRAIVTQTESGMLEARAPSHIRVPPGYVMTWKPLEIGGQPSVHYEIRPAPGLSARWRRLRYPHTIDKRDEEGS